MNLFFFWTEMLRRFKEFLLDTLSTDLKAPLHKG